MSFPAYPEYKDSGVVWLGGIPAHWNIKKFRYVFEESPEKITDEVVGDMLSVSGYRGIEVKQYDDEGRRRTDEELFGYRVVRPGQLVVNTMWLNYAGLGVSEHEGHVSPAYRSYWIDPAMDKRFIHHLMRSGTYVQGYTRLLTGIRPNSLQMGRDDLMVFPVLLPTKSEQTQIARFLDHETARIDALIEEQQRLIELLKEKRQAVISHAVTKGLDPTVPMKDSEISYLDKTPIHWLLRRLGDVVAFTQGKAHEPYIDDDGDFICVNSRFVSTEGNTKKYCSVNLTPASVNDILMVMSDLPNGRALARSYYVTENGKLAVNQRVCRITAEQANSRFLFYLLNRHPGLMQNDDGVNQTHLSNSDFLKLKIFLPTLAEQSKIAHYLDHEAVRFDTLISEAVTGVGLLQERRSALISAAVTGKIDVRGWQPPTSTQAADLAVAEVV